MSFQSGNSVDQFGWKALSAEQQMPHYQLIEAKVKQRVFCCVDSIR